jgi:hypothetical protein
MLQNLALIEEIRTSIRLLEYGFRSLQQIDGANDFYHVSLLTIASGFERLMKTIICLDVLETTGAFPTNSALFSGRKGHDLDMLLEKVLTQCFTSAYINSREAARQDYDYLTVEPEFRKLFRILSDFGQAARYYNLDVMLGIPRNTGSPEAEWKKLEFDFLTQDADWAAQLTDSAKFTEIRARINREIVSRLECCARALTRLFTLGGLGQLAKQQTGTIWPFLTLMDNDLGKRKY